MVLFPAVYECEYDLPQHDNNNEHRIRRRIVHTMRKSPGTHHRGFFFSRGGSRTQGGHF